MGNGIAKAVLQQCGCGCVGSQACQDHVGHACQRHGIQDGCLIEYRTLTINQTEYLADDCEQDGLMEK